MKINLYARYEKEEEFDGIAILKEVLLPKDEDKVIVKFAKNKKKRNKFHINNIFRVAA